MEDVLETYKQAYDPAYPVICMDESNKQHEKAKIKGTSAKPGKLERFDTSYEKNGVSNIFLSFEPLTANATSMLLSVEQGWTGPNIYENL